MTGTATPHTAAEVFPRINPADPEQVRPVYEELVARPIGSAAELERWLQDASDFHSFVDEYGKRCHIEKSRDTEDAEVERRFLQFVEGVEPQVVKPLFFRVQQKFVESPYRGELRDPKYAALGRRWEADVALFREQNVALETRLTTINSEYDKLCGKVTVRFRGADHTPAHMQKFIESTDRPTREEAWRLMMTRWLADRETLDGLFDEQLALRERVARSAGQPDYRAYKWKSLKRFDYTPDDCLRFADAIERTCVPLVVELDRRRKAALGVDELRPWDLNVDPHGQDSLHPFAADDVDGLVRRTTQIFARLAPSLAEDFDSLRHAGNLDLASRRGKQPGGYQEFLEASRQPFIFMNAAGLQRDVEILLHEGGHAFHSLAASRAQPLSFLWWAPMEFCEVASMSMELLGCEHFDVFYSCPADAARAKRQILEGVIEFLPWMATIDAFQHWLYTHPGHSRDERTAAWVAAHQRFGRKVSWAGLEDVRGALWQQKLHLYHVPFYYVEYGIAQLGAMQVWLKAKEDPRRALANYRAALRLGGTRPLPELFAAAGIQFGFTERTLKPLVDAVWEELEALPV